MNIRNRWYGCAAGLLFVAAGAWAHVPYLEGTDLTATQPFRCPSATQSIAVYSWLESSTDVDFYTVTVTNQTDFFAELIVPVFEPYAEFRPSMALIGRGLPAPASPLPVPLPPGSGAIVLNDAGLEPRPQFYEPFGGKSYYQGPRLEMTLPPGRYTLIYWDPAGGIGDYTAAIGDKEVWGIKDILRALIVTPIIRADGELHLP